MLTGDPNASLAAVSTLRPFVSVLMPVCNGARYLREAIRSVLEQDYPSFELVVVDDASDDETPRILAQVAADDRRVKVVTNVERGGRYSTRNRAFSAARPDSEFVAVMDADDVCERHRLKRQVEYLEAHPGVAVVGSHIRFIDEDSRPLGVRLYPRSPEDVRRRRLIENPFAHPTTMIRARVLRELGGYDGGRNVIGDYELFLRILERYEGANIDEPLVRYRISTTQSKTTNTHVVLRHSIRLKLDHLGLEDALRPAVLARFAGEVALCALPASVVLWLFRRRHGLA